MWTPWEQLPRKTISAGALFFNHEGKFIITKPNYKEGWNVPGGTVELEESPHEAFNREVKEELAIDKHAVSVLCVDYVIKSNSGHDHVSIVFDGGELTEEEIKSIKLQTEELDEYRFVSLEESQKLLAPNWAKRVSKCMDARKNHQTLYLENGDFIG